MTNFPDILYIGSPFLPTITSKNLFAVRRDMLENRQPTAVAISLELANAALELSIYYGTDLDWLIESFKTDAESIDIYTFGYIMAPSLIMGSHIMKLYGAKEAFKRICPPPTDKFLLNVNAYKTSHLADCYAIYQTLRFYQKKAGIEIIEYCRKNPYSPNRFYLAGIEAFNTNYLDLFEMLEKIH